MNRPGSFKSVYFLLALILGIIVFGTVGYILIEGYRLLDAFYMTVITIGTVGFREISPLSDAGKIFTALLILISFGSFGYVITTFTKFMVEGFFKNYYQLSKMKNKISKLEGHIIVCGYGNNGTETVHELLEHSEKVVIVEKMPEIIEQLRKNPDLLFIEGDATNENILRETNIENAKALITTMPNDADNLYIVLTAKELNNKITIVSRASDEHSIKKLKRAGANNVIMPDKIGGNRMAKLVVQPDIVEFMEFIFLQQRRDIKVEEVSCYHSVFIDKSIRDLDVRNASGANILGIRTADGNYHINPSADTIIHNDDKLFVLGSPSQIEKLRTVIRGS
jgi:voltage-gated potassium channel